jgi:hypothetical protein
VAKIARPEDFRMKDRLCSAVLVTERWEKAAMSAERQLDLAGTAAGRVMLHLLALNTDWKVRWHVVGILRELRNVPR